jgi:PTH1 family peptidyl-tRNA hydrolase
MRRFWTRLFGSRQEASRDPGPCPSHVIVGLGNPGEQYRSTRHNIGFRIVETLADRHGAAWMADRALSASTARVEIAGEACLLLRPTTFMNRSGTSVCAALDRWPELAPDAALLVVYDDLDLPTGRIRLRPGGGGGGHRGIGDILMQLDTQAIPRLRFGVDHPGSSGAVIDWVLQPFAPEEETLILPDAIQRSVDAIESVVQEGVVSAMGQFNANS